MDAVSRILAGLMGFLPLDDIQVEWVPDNARYRVGVWEATPGVRLHLESGLVGLGKNRSEADERWVARFAPWSFSAELYDDKRHILVDITDAASLTIELKKEALDLRPAVARILDDSGLKCEDF
ncbi:hypothetical protein ACO229_18085 [Promicromonospora sp. MS192]|uniref:hypothetical protein n=1 Tax=Promicromonospora sp. MS192 TaxID=3412684 RepID=UPI003C2E474E